jgi:hypothetical protein
LKTQIASLQEENEKMKDLNEKMTERNEKMKELHEKMENESLKMKEENGKLKEENEKFEAIFQSQQMKGDYDPTKTKVLHLKFNPFEMMKQKRLEEWKELKVENEKLQMRLRVLEESGGKDLNDLTQRAEAEGEDGGRLALTKEVEDLKVKSMIRGTISDTNIIVHNNENSSNIPTPSPPVSGLDDGRP